MIAKLRCPNFTELFALTIICIYLVKGEIVKESPPLCAKFTQKCTFNLRCCNPDHMCKPIGRGAFRFEKRCLKSVLVTLGRSCKSTYDCDKIRFSKCSENNKCVCEAGFVAFDSLTCSSPQLNGSCSSNNDCEYAIHSKCGDNNKCVCRANNVVVNERCLPIVNGLCWKNETCGTKNSICIDSTCQCKPGFKFSPQINDCLQSYLGKPCEVNSNCDKIVNAECSNNKRCICNKNSMMLDEFSCGPKLGGACSASMECLPENLRCVQNICRCKSGFFASNGKCSLAATKLGMACASKTGCKNLYNSDCIEGQCICQSNTLAVNQTACLSLIDGSCQSHENCQHANSVCISNRCECKLQYVPVSSSQCILENSAVNCRSNADCGDEMRRECSTNNKCVCKSNSIAIATRQCKSLIGGYCDEDSDCNVMNSFCEDNACQCKFSLTPISRNLCPESY